MRAYLHNTDSKAENAEMADWVELDTDAEAMLAVPDGSAHGAVVVGAELFGITS
jgi:dTDP-4-dehydrorhamnose 3,5-epimerase-like enzyme